MAIIVQKYGGSSLADIERIQRVADRVVHTHRQGHQVVVVVSAMGKTTDGLLAMATQINDQPSRRELDMLLSVGERISMALLSMAIQARGVDAISFTGSQCGILTNASHSHARIVEVRPFRVQDELELGKVVIVAGYQGTSYRREITTLGRGGSDTTAVALAAALDAAQCEIYSDVDGVYSADPRVVVNAARLEELTYDEMLALSRHGARVLHADAVAFAQKKNIALFMRSSFLPDDSSTVVRKNLPIDRDGPTGIVGKKGLHGLLVFHQKAMAHLLDRLTIPVEYALYTGERGLLLCSPETPLPPPIPNDYEHRLGLGVVTLVGNIQTEESIAWAMKNAPIQGFILGPQTLSFITQEEHVDDMLRKGHSHWMEKK